MKLKVLLLLFAFKSSTLALCQLTEMNFDCGQYDVESCNPFLAPPSRCLNTFAVAQDWYSSHGSPDIVWRTINTLNQKYAHFTSSSEGNLPAGALGIGEGIFISYEFKKGRKYSLEIFAMRGEVEDVSKIGRLSFKAVNPMSAGGVEVCEGNQVLPLLDAGEEWEWIYPLDASKGLATSRKSFLAPDFAPTKDFSKLWIHSEELQADSHNEYFLYYLTVLDLGPVGSGTPPSLPQPSGDQCISSNWVSPIALKIINPEVDQKFATSATAEGDYFAVGSPTVKKVYIYKLTACQAVLEATLTGTGNFGYSLDMDSDQQIIVGNPAESKAHIFMKNGESWVNTATLTSSSDFGHSVAIDKGHASVGAPAASTTSAGAGKTVFYIKNISGIWDYAQTLHPPDKIYSGISLDIRNNTAVITAKGKVNFYRYISGNGWQSQTDFSNPDGLEGSFFGKTAEFTDDGVECFVSGGKSSGSGALFRYALNNGVWENMDVIQSGNNVDYEFFSVSQSKLVVRDGGALVFYERGQNWIRVSRTFAYIALDNDGLYAYKFSILSLTDKFLFAGRPSSCAPATGYIYDTFFMMNPQDRSLCDNAYFWNMGRLAGNNIDVGCPSQVTFLPTSSATLQGNSIVFRPNFHAQRGAKVQATAFGCDFGPGVPDWASYSSLQDEVTILQSPEEAKVSDESTDEFNTYPNPTTDGTFTVRSRINKIQEVKVYNLQGVEVATNRSLISDYVVNVKISSPSQGLYMVRIVTGNRASVVKVIQR
jgi:hypothetical protein